MTEKNLEGEGARRADGQTNAADSQMHQAQRGILPAEGVLLQITFVGETLGPFFLQDPKTGAAGPMFGAISALDSAAACHEWPFVAPDEAKSCLDEMQEGLREGAEADDLTWEYRRLFIGPFPKPAPPWGSVYTDREGVVFGEGTLELRRWMRERGINRLIEEADPEDHIGFMLILLAWMAENKPEDLEEYLSEHLLTWSSHFLAQLVDAAEHPFYRGLARLTKASLEGIQGELGLEVTYPRFFR